MSHSGATPVRNKFHVPSADGCGSLGLGIATEYLPVSEMNSCCDQHDICYDTCNKDKELCDIEFKRCLYNYCDQYEKTAVGGDMMVKGKTQCNCFNNLLDENFNLIRQDAKAALKCSHRPP